MVNGNCCSRQGEQQATTNREIKLHNIILNKNYSLRLECILIDNYVDNYTVDIATDGHATKMLIVVLVLHL